MSEQTVQRFGMIEKNKSERNLKFIARGAQFTRLAILLILVPIGIAILILGLDQLRLAYSAHPQNTSVWSLGLTSFGGVLIIFALIVILLSYLVEQRLTAHLREQEFAAHGRGSIQRLHEWLPRDEEAQRADEKI